MMHWTHRRRTRFILTLATVFPAALLLMFLLWLLQLGLPHLSWEFLVSLPSVDPMKAGVGAAITGTLLTALLATLLTLPIGMGAALHLEEFSGRPLWVRMLEKNVAALAGVPSVLYGLVGLGVFVRWMELGRSSLSAGCTLALLALPMIVITSQEAIRGVDPELRQAAVALGASPYRILRNVILPNALPAMISGSFLSMARVMGEAAPLLVLGAWMYISFLPVEPMEPFTVLPVQIFHWGGHEHPFALGNAAAGVLILLFLLLLTRGWTLWLRKVLERRISR